MPEERKLVELVGVRKAFGDNVVQAARDRARELLERVGIPPRTCTRG